MTTTTIDRDAAAYDALQAAGGNKAQAAEAVGMARSTFGDAVKRHTARIAQDGDTEGPAAPADPFAGIPNADDQDNAPLLPPAPAPEQAAPAEETTQAAGKPGKPQPSPCLCGCGQTAKWDFIQGHGSRYAGALRADYVAGRKTREQVLAAAGEVIWSSKFSARMAAMLDRVDQGPSQARRSRSLGWLTEVSVVGQGSDVRAFRVIVQASTPQDAYLAAQNALSAEADAFALFTLYEPDEVAEVIPGYLFHVGDRSSVTIRNLDAAVAA